MNTAGERPSLKFIGSCMLKQDTLQRTDDKSMFWIIRSTEDVCSKFALHFNEKVQRIRAESDVARSSNIVMQKRACFKELLVAFMPTSGEEIHKIMSRLTNTCELDFLPSKQF